MAVVLGFLLIFVVILIVLLALSTGIGFLLHWLVPGVDMGLGILIGLLATGLTIYLYGRLTSLATQDEPAEGSILIDARPGSPFEVLGPLPSRRRRRGRAP